MIRGANNSPYEYARSDEYNVEKILNAAEMVGKASETELVEKLRDAESGVRYWSVMGIRQLDSISDETVNELQKILDDESPSVSILAAEVLCHFGDYPKAVDTLGKWVQDERPWLAMQAARSIQLVGEDARPLIPIVYKVLYKNRGDGSKHKKYLDFNYSAFTSWSLEWALQELGEDIQVN